MKIIIDLDSPKDISEIKRILAEMETLLPPRLYKEKKSRIPKADSEWVSQESMDDEYLLHATDVMKWSFEKACEEFKKFQDYNLQKGRTCKDWLAAWRTWCSNSVQFAKR